MSPNNTKGNSEDVLKEWFPDALVNHVSLPNENMAKGEYYLFWEEKHSLGD